MTKIPSYEEMLVVKTTLLDLKMLVIATQIQAILRKYRPDQPRVPAGRPTGGQWTDGGTTDAVQMAGKWDLSREPFCNEQLRLDEELCRIAKNRLCWSLTQPRWAACMKTILFPSFVFRR
jgi:hypothetical protein